MEVNYFVCTLGQAALPGVSRPFKDVNHLIDEQASHRPDSPAVAFYRSNGTRNAYTAVVLTFAEVKRGVEAVAELFTNSFTIGQCQTVGLLSNSSPTFFFSWLALIRLGHPVLLIAPQCSASAIVHLSQACAASTLLHDGAHRKLATDAASYSADVGYSSLTAHVLPISDDEELFESIRGTLDQDLPASVAAKSDVVYLHHTSGTSSGIPKPIPQTNHGAIGVLPALDGSTAATFTTTPLYHGGPADIFRAWTSNALIWLFPGHHAPITAANIVRCLDTSTRTVTETKVAPIRYFSSVPYVLQMMAQDELGLQHLQAMDLVGVGGAALPPEVGNMLVAENVHLLSRYGSAECGFLMSSHRDYDRDKDWLYLRRSPEVQQLKFEPNSDGQSELVVLSGWPHMAKTNREDGSFATADLFAPHPTIPHAWRYHSRADSQLTLITGKKFDPSPVETSLAAASHVISEVLVFGNGQQYPGALLFRSFKARDLSDAEVVQTVAPAMEKLNTEGQSHARISRNMLVPMAYHERPLEKSSKGTILRGRAEEKYQKDIEQAYRQNVVDGDVISDKDVPDTVLKIIKSITGAAEHGDHELEETTNLFAFGVDSLASAQIRLAVAQLLPKNSKPLPLSIVEDAGDIATLSDVILRVRKGETARLNEDQDALLQELVGQYGTFKSTFQPMSAPTSHGGGITVLMTGPTGSLGAYILSQLLENPKITKIHLLIRGVTPHAARERVLKALSSRRLPIPSTFDTKVNVMSCKLSDPNLGLSDTDYSVLTREVDMIFHLAWSVNFLVSLRSLATTHLAGLQNLLNLALSSQRSTPPRFFFCSSIASVSNFFLSAPTIPETIVKDITACGPTGYARSKLAGELICASCASTTALHNRITILRVGQLSGDAGHGVWNKTEAYPLMLAGSKTTKILPRLEHEPLSWLPVDVAATCFIEAAMAEIDDTSDDKPVTADPPIRVLHLLNPSRSTTFPDLLQCLKTNTDADFEIVSTHEWLTRLEDLKHNEETKDHPALKLLGFWKDVYGPGSRDTDSGGESEYHPYVMDTSLRVMPSLKRAIGPLDREYMVKLWRWIEDNF